MIACSNFFQITSEMVALREMPTVISSGVTPWPYFKVKVHEYIERVVFSFIGAVEKLKFEVELQRNFGSQTASIAPSTVSGLSDMSRETTDHQHQGQGARGRKR